MPVDDTDINVRLLDDAHKALWMAHPFIWTVESLNVIPVVNGQQDYTLTPDANLLYLESCQLVDAENKKDLIIASTIPLTNIITGPVTQVMYVSDPQSLRLFPVPAAYPSTTPALVSIAKLKALNLTSGNISTDYSTLTGFRNEWFWVYQELVLLKAFTFTHDGREGAVGTDSTGQSKYSGQWAVAMDAIARMWASEKRIFSELGDEIQNG
jgi:hypothetical protein